MTEENQPEVTISLVIDEAENLIPYRDSEPDLDPETRAVLDDLIEKGRAVVWPRGAAGSGPGEPDRGDDHL